MASHQISRTPLKYRPIINRHIREIYKQILLLLNIRLKLDLYAGSHMRTHTFVTNKTKLICSCYNKYYWQTKIMHYFDEIFRSMTTNEFYVRARARLCAQHFARIQIGSVFR